MVLVGEFVEGFAQEVFGDAKLVAGVTTWSRWISTEGVMLLHPPNASWAFNKPFGNGHSRWAQAVADLPR
jgi:hypothetical protein